VLLGVAAGVVPDPLAAPVDVAVVPGMAANH
jgi:hypothetical protein